MASNTRILTAASGLLAMGSLASAAGRSIPAGSEIRAGSSLGRHLLAHARREGGRALEENDYDYSYVANYEIKFQGCHHISQWNGEAEGEDDVRVYTKRLARFRLCPAGSCDSDDSSGCSAKYGDYVVDMSTFLEAWLEAQEDEKEYQCEVYQEKCQDMCDANDGDDDCEQACYAGYGVSYCLDDDDGNDNDNGFDAQDYAECVGFDFGRRKLEDGDGGNDGEAEYYVGPYCADQGGEIRLGLFTDETCTAFSSTAFENMAGYTLPYSESPGMVGSMCMSCGEQDGQDEDGDGEVDVKEVCENLYTTSGKCETKMSIDYPNESACTYIEGIKIIREDGVIRTTTTKKSKAAAVCIGLFTTAAVLLGAYVYYLRTKLGRAKINLSSQ